MIRGVIEGFYGTPWSHDERLDLMAAHFHGLLARRVKRDLARAEQQPAGADGVGVGPDGVRCVGGEDRLSICGHPRKRIAPPRLG